MKLFSTLAVTTAAATLIAGGAIFGRTGEPAMRADTPELVSVMPGTGTYRLPGEYTSDGRATDAPERPLAFTHRIEMMKHQVSAADYARCVAAGACKPADSRQTGADVPVTGVDHQDAVDYANWLSQETGRQWRLPTDAEWAFAAAERFRQEAVGGPGDAANPAARLLRIYRAESAAAPSDPEPKPYGHFGVNSKGIADMAGNVWDWTSTCYARAAIGRDGSLGRGVENCGVRVAAGRHRAYMSFFIRDGKSGGCAAGIAPDNLGIRLVREAPSLLGRLKGLLPKSVS